MMKLKEFVKIGRALFEEGIVHSTSGNMSVMAGDIERAIHQTVNEQKQVALTDIKFIEKYEGDKIAEGQRGLGQPGEYLIYSFMQYSWNVWPRRAWAATGAAANSVTAATTVANSSTHQLL